MKVTSIPMVIGAFGRVTKNWLKGLEDLEVGGRVETIQTTTWMRTARILRSVLETWEDLLWFKSNKRPSAKTDVKNSNEWMNEWIIIIIIVMIIDSIGWARWCTENCASNLNRPYEQILLTQLRICPGEWDAETPVDFWDTKRFT